MGRNKQLRKRLAGARRAIAIHEEKIRRERAKSAPDDELLRKWQRDLKVFKDQERYALEHLP